LLMLNTMQTLVDLDATISNAPHLGEKVLGWLISERIIQPALSPCTLSGDGSGYAPGPGMETWINDPAGVARTRSAALNGLSLVTERMAHSSVSTAYATACPKGDKVSLGGDLEAAINEWVAGGPARLTCPACQKDFPLTDWDLGPDYVFACLAFRFLNWPEDLGRLFDEIRRILSPDRIAVV
jgi:hypothetical protein